MSKFYKFNQSSFSFEELQYLLAVEVKVVSCAYILGLEIQGGRSVI